MIFFVEDETFKAIANAIRNKTGTLNKITPLQMPDKILSIIESSSGGSTPSSSDAQMIWGMVTPRITFKSFEVDFLNFGLITQEDNG